MAKVTEDIGRVGRVYRAAWHQLRDEVLEEKTGWGRIELRQRMDRLLLECFEQDGTQAKGDS